MSAIDEIINVLQEYNKLPSDKIPSALLTYLESIAKIGRTRIGWKDIRHLFCYKLDLVMHSLNEENPMDDLEKAPNVENISYSQLRERIFQRLSSFNAAPFTIQRLCELITEPKRHYKRVDKFMRGIEKNIMVVSCVDPEGQKLATERSGALSPCIINGFETNGDASSPTPPVAPPPPPVATLHPVSTTSSPFKPPSPATGSWLKTSDRSPVSSASGPPATSTATASGSPTSGLTAIRPDTEEPPHKILRLEPADSGAEANEVAKETPSDAPHVTSSEDVKEARAEATSGSGGESSMSVGTPQPPKSSTDNSDKDVAMEEAEETKETEVPADNSSDVKADSGQDSAGSSSTQDSNTSKTESV